LIRSLKIAGASEYLDSRPKILPAGKGIPKAAGKAKQLMKNLSRGGCRKFSDEDFYFQLLQRTSGMHCTKSRMLRRDRLCTYSPDEAPEAAEECSPSRKAGEYGETKLSPTGGKIGQRL
jgi:hypothetical protein